MSVQPICVEPNRVLRQSAQPVVAFTDALRRLARDLIDTMYAHDGIGIAAPQIGHRLQVFVANPGGRRGQELVLVNPVLVRADGRAALVEGCLSVPKVWERVRRAAAVHVTGQDVFGEPLTIQADGLLAAVVQHELDHLHGTLFIDRVPWYRRHRLWGAPWRRRRPATRCA